MTSSPRPTSLGDPCATFPRVTDELAELQARLTSLGPNAGEEQVAVNEAILRLKAGDLVATESDGFAWRRCDGLSWPHPSLVVVGVDVA
jgi:hypothetical protein